jgi:hypothetical protein
MLQLTILTNLVERFSSMKNDTTLLKKAYG